MNCKLQFGISQNVSWDRRGRVTIVMMLTVTPGLRWERQPEILAQQQNRAQPRLEKRCARCARCDALPCLTMRIEQSSA